MADGEEALRGRLVAVTQRWERLYNERGEYIDELRAENVRLRSVLAKLGDWTAFVGDEDYTEAQELYARIEFAAAAGTGPTSAEARDG